MLVFLGIVGFVVALLVCLGMNEVLEVEKIRYYAIVFMAVLAVFVGMGVSFDNYDTKSYIADYSATKQTYENAIKSSSLSDLENLKIVDTAIDENSTLARKQTTINAWWNFAISKDLKNQVTSLSPIDVG